MGGMHNTNEMTHPFFLDMSSYSYLLLRPVQTVQNVGWLSGTEQFARGEVAPSFLKKLREIILADGPVNVHVNKMRGRYSCAISAECGRPVAGGGAIGLTSSQIWIPSESEYFASPSLIYHYIEEHGYLPPEEFAEAVMLMDLEKKFVAQETYLELIAGHF